MTDDWKNAVFRQVPGTNAIENVAFINQILGMLVGGPPRTFICDNLRSHSSAAVVHAIYAAGHRIVPRPAYYPEDGPVEFVINEIEMGLRQQLYVIRNYHDLVREGGTLPRLFAV